MELRHLQYGRRCICIAIGMALLGSFGVTARPLDPAGPDDAARVAASA